MRGAVGIGRSLLLILLALVALGLASATPAAPTSTVETVVTIQFDDGRENAYGALPILEAHGMHATFYVNTDLLGGSGYMSWGQLADLAAAGNEIAGHTLTHANLKRLSTAAARREVCNDRVNLFEHGFQPTSFAYPYGQFNSSVKQVVRECGYSSARGVSGVDGRTTFAETIPPRDAYATRTPQLPKRSTSLATIKRYVTDAEQHGGGWVQLVFHNLCNGCNTYAITPADFTALLDWLQPRAALGTVVKTTGEVIGGTVQPPVSG